MISNWDKYTSDYMLYHLTSAYIFIEGTSVKKIRNQNNNDKRHIAKMIEKRRKRSRNLKTHRI